MSDTIREAVHAQVEQKIAAGEALQQSIDNERAARAVADEAARATQTARRDALRAGWSETELKRLGLAHATKSRRSRTTPTAEAQDASDHNDA